MRTLSRPDCAMSRHDLHVSTKLNHDLECQVTTWEPQSLSKSFAIENYLSRQNSLVVCATLLCEHPSRARMPVVGAWLYCGQQSDSAVRGRAPLSHVLCDRPFGRGKLCRDLKILCRDRFSPYPGQLYCDIELLCRDIISPCLSQLCRNLKILCRDRKSSQPDQLCRDIKFLCRNTQYLHLAILCRDIKTLCCDRKTLCRDRKLLAWPTLS